MTNKHEKFTLPKEIQLKKTAIERVANLIIKQTIKRGGTITTLDVAGKIVDEIDRMGLSESMLLIAMNDFVIRGLTERGIIRK
jgi:hypothetical protein